MAVKKRGKYHAVKVIHDGITFDSQLEGRRYLVLKERESRGEISDLVCHPRYPIHVLGKLVCTYIADFRYDEETMCDDSRALEWVRIVEDVKGFITPVYRLKKKLMRIVHGIEILETH